MNNRKALFIITDDKALLEKYGYTFIRCLETSTKMLYCFKNDGREIEKTEYDKAFIHKSYKMFFED